MWIRLSFGFLLLVLFFFFFFSFCTPGKFLWLFFFLFCWLKHLWCENTAENINIVSLNSCVIVWDLKLKRNCRIDFLLSLDAHFYTFRLQYLNIASFMSFTRIKSHTEKNRIEFMKKKQLLVRKKESEELNKNE